MKILFVCSANTNRSPSFERYFSKHFPKHEFRSAGTYYGYPYQVDAEILRWADKVYVMDLSHAKFIYDKYPTYYKKVETIGISDQYDPDSRELIELIQFWIRMSGVDRYFIQ